MRENERMERERERERERQKEGERGRTKGRGGKRRESGRRRGRKRVHDEKQNGGQDEKKGGTRGTGQDRTGQHRIGQDKTRQDSTEEQAGQRRAHWSKEKEKKENKDWRKGPCGSTRGGRVLKRRGWVMLVRLDPVRRERGFAQEIKRTLFLLFARSNSLSLCLAWE